MEPIQTVALLIVAAAAAFTVGAAADLWRYHRRRRQESPWPPRSRDGPGHVHTFRFSSAEEVNGQHVNVYRCIECPTIERWVADYQA